MFYGVWAELEGKKLSNVRNVSCWELKTHGWAGDSNVWEMNHDASAKHAWW